MAKEWVLYPFLKNKIQSQHLEGWSRKIAQISLRYLVSNEQKPKIPWEGVSKIILLNDLPMVNDEWFLRQWSLSSVLLN
jgi:hypothetical protein